MTVVTSPPSAGSIFGYEYGFGLYVHWPFCSKICPYCDFNVYASKERVEDDLVTAICTDIVAHKRHLPAHGTLDSIYLGGGTPSLMSPRQIGQILDTAKQSFGLEEGVEITLEANPNDILKADIDQWVNLGISRLSIGVQSLNDAALVFLGRDHNVATVRQALEKISGRFDSVSIDLIYARPDQTKDMWEAELTEAISLGADHLSLYELTIEPETAFGMAVSRNKWVPMNESQQADLYEVTHLLMTKAGYPAYEVSNHARSLTHRSVHNTTYWAGGDWIGVGPGAHGRLTIKGNRFSTSAEIKPEGYKAMTQKVGLGYEQPTRLGSNEIAQELLFMGLRRSEGIVASRVETAGSFQLNREKIRVFVERGWMRVIDGRIALTPSGWLLADAISKELFP